MAATRAIPTRRHSVQISTISTTLRGTTKRKDLFIKVDLGGVRIEKRRFRDQSPSKIQFNPPRSLDGAATIRVQLCKSNFIRDTTVLAMMEFTLQKAQEILGDLTEVTDHLVFSNAAAEFRLSFSMKSNAAHDLIRAGVDVTSNLKSILDHLGSGFKFFDTVLSLGAAASEVNPIAKAVLASVSEVKKLLETQDKCEKEIYDLVVGMGDCLHCIADVRQFAKSDQLLNSLEALDPLVRDTANFISQYGSFSLTTRIVSLNFSNKTRDQLESLNRRFLSFKERFDRGVAAQTGLTMEEIKTQLNVILDDSAFREEATLLRTLKPGISDIRRGQEECMEDTRVDILRVIDEWIDDDEGPNLFWLHGHPGTGKSTIAASVRSRLLKAHQLGSSFFFRREDFASQTPEALWCTVAYDLAQKFSAIRRLAAEKLKSQEVVPNITSHDDIFNKLIAIPLTLSPDELPGRPLVIVIDALDECGGLQESQSYQRPVLRALGRCQSLPLRVKIFITSRNDGNIESVLGTGGPRIKVLEVGRDVTKDSSLDIEKYLRRGFGEILAEFRTIPTPWPTESDLQILTNTAAGLFIWASTVLNLIRDGDPIRDLDAILAMIRSHGMHMSPSMDLLGQLYATILASKFKTRDQIIRFVKVAGAVIAARTPLSSEDLVELISPLSRMGFEKEKLDRTDFETICKKLKSVLDTASGLRFLHQSFVDFLISLPIESQFRCEKGEHEKRLAVACLSTMEQKLHFNMGNINTSYFQDGGVPYTSEQIPPAVYYSCRFWVTHLNHIEAGEMVLQQVQSFMHLKVLFWLEVMSIRGEVGTVSASLDSLLSWQPLNDNIQLRNLTKDILYFVQSYATPITLAAPHIYLSAFAFAPRRSLTKKAYSRQISGVLKIETGDDLGWHPLQAVLRGHTACVTSVAFSPDGKWVVSGADDHTARIWDIETHQQQLGKDFTAHTHDVTSVAFSPNGSRVVSGSHDRTVRIWSPDTHQQIGETLVGHTDGIRSVAFSPNGTHIASGSHDHTVRIWDAETHLQIGVVIPAHTDHVSSIAFSHDGKLILTGHTDDITSIAFSPSGTHVVSGSRDCTVRIWDTERNQQMGETLIGHTEGIRSVTFSPNGKHIASGSHDHTIRIWDAETCMHTGAAIVAHTDHVASIAFSRDGKLIVSGSSDCTLRIWNAETQEQIGETLEGHTESVRSVVFSPDDKKYIVSASDDHTIRIWDANTHQQVGEPLTGHTDSVVSVAFSKNGTRVVSGSYDSTLRMWDVETHQQIGKSMGGHNAAV
ncbi:hypothetical protein FB451DRAFT_1495082, partial [Mycena latifolia]